MRNIYLALAFLAVGVSLEAQTYITTLAQLQDCLNASPSQVYANNQGLPAATTCQLMPGTHSVTSQLTINRSGITITGTMISGPSNTTLRRTADITYIMKAGSSSITNVTISYLTFDGNRYGFGVAPVSSHYSTPP